MNTIVSSKEEKTLVKSAKSSYKSLRKSNAVLFKEQQSLFVQTLLKSPIPSFDNLTLRIID